jgi:Flp pilus assembly CpaE family ATPase
MLDIVQELMSINEQVRSRKNARASRVIAVMQAKGGVGTTSTCAALAEVCAQNGQRSMLWDLDIETRDLCRALMVEGEQPAIVREFIQGEREVSRESLRQALMPVSDHISVLPPPDHMGACIDYVGRVDGLETIQSIIDLSRITHENVIIDLGGRIGPAAAAIMRSADAVVIMLDDSLLGLSAARFLLPTLRSVVKNPESIYFLCSGISVPQSELARQIEQEIDCGSQAWSLPAIPFDAAAARWAGSGTTMYSTAKRQTQRVFEEIATGLGLLNLSEPEVKSVRFRPQLLGTKPSLSALTAAVVVGFVSLFTFLWHRV